MFRANVIVEYAFVVSVSASCVFTAIAAQPAAAQQTAPSPQCADNAEQIRDCSRAVEQCTADYSVMVDRRRALTNEVAALKSRTCAQESEPRWREIVRTVVDARLASLKRTRTATNCEEFSYEIGNNARVVFKGRLRDLAPIQQAKLDLTKSLPGLEIDDQQVRAQEGDCPVGVIDGYVLGAREPTDRDAIGARRLQRIPAAESCGDLGAKLTAAADLSPEQRARFEEGFWVFDSGLSALCRKSQAAASGGWEVTKQNLERGMLIVREPN